MSEWWSYRPSDFLMFSPTAYWRLVQRYNIGAGISRISIASSFVRAAMPYDRPGSLTAQQAYDVAAYMNSHARPDFPGKEKDWPKGDAPADAAYRTIAKQGDGRRR